MAGVSDNENKIEAVAWIRSIGPDKVLDVGAGMGIYSIMAKQPNQHWTAIEVFAPYVEMFNLNSRYEDIIIADVRYVDWEKLGDFDLTILADMLEHMSRDSAKDIIEEALEHSRYVLICFPLVHHDQHAGHEGNTFETHVDHWDYEQMHEFLTTSIGVEVKQTIRGEVLAYFMVEGTL